MKEESRKRYYLTILAFVLVTLVIAGIAMRFLPDTVPVHFSANGVVDRYGSKYELFAVAGILGLLDFVFAAGLPEQKGIAASSEDGEKEEASKSSNRKVMRGIGIGISALNLVVVLILVISIGAGTQYEGILEDRIADILTTVTTIAMSVGFIFLGNIMPKTKPNGLVGVRTSWSSYNDVCWARSNRFGGYTMIFVGVISIIMTAIVQGITAMYTMVALLLIGAGAMIWYSYKVYKEEKEKEER